METCKENEHEYMMKSLEEIFFKDKLEVESKLILKLLPKAHAALAELKGIARSIPNQDILLNSLVLQEAKDSSAIENIVTTHDELFKNELLQPDKMKGATKEVNNYKYALRKGLENALDEKMISIEGILEIQKHLQASKPEFRSRKGTVLKNLQTGEIVYTPPQELSEITSLLIDLETFIADNSLYDFDPIIKLAILHFQFESIHPFYDGNGRVGRILNIIYLVLEKLLDSPVLYLSRYIIKNKIDYYWHLQQVRENNKWEEWLVFIIEGVYETATETTELIKNIHELMLQQKHLIRENFKFYSQDLLNILFKHPYSKVEFLVEELGISRITAANYLNQLAEFKLLTKNKFGKSNYYMNNALCELLTSKRV